MSRGAQRCPHRPHSPPVSTTRQAMIARSGSRTVPDGLQAELLEPTERGQIRVGEGSVSHVEVLRMGGVRIFILRGPRRLPGQRRADADYTLNCEEPVWVRRLTRSGADLMPVTVPATSRSSTRSAPPRPSRRSTHEWHSPSRNGWRPRQYEVTIPKQVPAVEVGKQRLCYQWHATKVAFVGSNAESTPSPLFPEGSPQ